MRDSVSIEIQNVDIDSIQYPSLFRLRKYPEHIEIYRQKKHCIKKVKEDRWLRIPISFDLKESREYSIEAEVKSTYPLMRVFFISRKNKTIRLDAALNPDEWTKINVSFTSDFDGPGNITITATDLPVAGHYLYIRRLVVKGKRKKATREVTED